MAGGGWRRTAANGPVHPAQSRPHKGSNGPHTLPPSLPPLHLTALTTSTYLVINVNYSATHAVCKCSKRLPAQCLAANARSTHLIITARLQWTDNFLSCVHAERHASSVDVIENKYFSGLEKAANNLTAPFIY